MVLGTNQQIKIISISEEEVAFDNNHLKIAQHSHSKKPIRNNLKILLTLTVLLASLYMYVQLGVSQEHALVDQERKELKNDITSDSGQISIPMDEAPFPTSEYTTDEMEQKETSQRLEELAQLQPIPKETTEESPTEKELVQQQTLPSTPKQAIRQIPKSIKRYPHRAIASYVLKRRESFKQIIAGLKKKDQNQLKSHLSSYNITSQQFYRALVLVQHAPLDMPATKSPTQEQTLTRLDLEERNYYESKYNISKYQELPMCVVVPSYKNYKRFRYFFNLHTITQQHYSNYHVVIIDDASNDQGVRNLEQEVKGYPEIREKVTLVKNDNRQYHMANFYNAIHKYCKKGQILVTIDGDDELVGRYVFKVINAAYHRSRSLAIYSNHLNSRREVLFDIGISNAYPQQVKQNNSYRQAKHLYSHLRTTWVDLFLLIKESDLKTSRGTWFTNLVDNAIFYPIFQLSCGEVEYLSEVLYKYNTFTGQNVDNLPYWMRKETSDEINTKEKYRCLRQWANETYDSIKSYIA